MSSESFITLPPDSTGKNVRTVQKTIGATTVHEEVFVVGSPRKLVGVYQYASPVVTGSTTSGYVYHSFFNPTTSTDLVAVRYLRINWVTAASAVYIEAALFRITSVSGGTTVPVTNVGKKDTNYPDPTIDIRYANPTVTLAQKMLSFITPGAVGQTIGIVEQYYKGPDGRSEIILRPGEGLALRQQAAGDADFRVIFVIEWEQFQGLPVVV